MSLPCCHHGGRPVAPLREIGRGPAPRRSMLRVSRPLVEVVIVRRYLVVANQTLGGDQLLACVQERMRAGPSHFHVLVPATPASQLDQEYVASVPAHVRVAASAQPGDDDRLAARELLEDEADEFDEIILSTLPGRRSRWLATDLPSRVRRTHKLPVTQVTGPAHAAPQTTKE